MIVNVICDECQEAVATRLVLETKWRQSALCNSCHELVDHDAIYECRELWPNVKDGLRGLVASNPDATTTALIEWVTKNVSIPVFLPPFDTAVRDALRDRECFRAIKTEGSRAFRYEVI